MLVILYNNNFKFKVNSVGVSLTILVILLETQSFLYSGVNASSAISRIVYMLFIFFFAYTKQRKLCLLEIIHSFYYGFCLLVTSLIGQTVKYSSWKDVISSNKRFGDIHTNFNISENLSITSVGVNSLAMICLVVISSTLVLINLKKYKKFEIFVFLLAFMVGLATLSKMFIVAVILVFCMYGSLSVKLSAKLVYQIVVILIVGCISFYHLQNYLISAINRFMVADISNGRFELYSEYLHKMAQRPLSLILGIGIEDIRFKYDVVLGGFYSSPHNAIFEIIIGWGIVGLTAIIIMLSLIINKIKGFKDKFLYGLPIITLLISTQAEHGFTQKMYIWLLFIAINICYLSNEKDNNNLLDKCTKEKK